MSVLVSLQGAVDNRNVTFQVTGGGVVTAVTRKGASSTVSITGGGIIAITARKGAQITVSLTGGGVITMSATKGGITLATVTGGGRITPNFVKGGIVFFTVTGGGMVTMESLAPTPEEAMIIIETDGGGPVAKRRAGSITPFDDWTATMDDEAILALYLLRTH